MDRQGQSQGVRFGIMMLIGLLFIANDALAHKKKWTFAFASLKRHLVISQVPRQEAQINSNFFLNLDSFINVVKPEINLQITNQSKWASSAFDFHRIPLGTTYRAVGENLCGSPRLLQPGESCVVHFEVDKSKYKHEKNNGPHFQHREDDLHLGESFDHIVYALVPTQVTVTPTVQNGLQYDPATHSIVGTPTLVGEYQFTVEASNGSNIAAPMTFRINVKHDPKDKPVFKHIYSIAAATPNRSYRLNLLDLIEKKPSFGVTNQVHFRIDPNHTLNYPTWLDLDPATATVLVGDVPAGDAGQIKELMVIASSNTGGDSADSLTIRIPVAVDPTKKPVIQQGLVFKGAAGSDFHHILTPLIMDPAADGSLRISLDNVEPAAPWLSISPSMVLEGVVPIDAVGQSYQLTLRANNKTGGSSEPVTIPMHIDIDQGLTPRFASPQPEVPLLYAGQPYVFDFVSSNGIYPEYRDFPYTVELAKGYDNPGWLRIEDNKIIADNVPQDVDDIQPTLFITIKNGPGGKSAVMPISLFIMR